MEQQQRHDLLLLPADEPSDVSPSPGSLLGDFREMLLHVALRYRVTSRLKRPNEGFVLVYCTPVHGNLKAFGWSLSPEPHELVPGVYLVDCDGGILIAGGGSDENGSERFIEWIGPLKEIGRADRLTVYDVQTVTQEGLA